MVRWVLTISALLAWAFAAMLLFAARQFEAPVGIQVTDKVATIAQAQGATLVGLGLINWLSRTVTDVRALRAVLAGNLAVQIASFAVAARAIALGLFPTTGFRALLIHTVFGLWFAWALWRIRRVSAA